MKSKKFGHPVIIIRSLIDKASASHERVTASESQRAAVEAVARHDTLRSTLQLTSLDPFCPMPFHVASAPTVPETKTPTVTTPEK